MSQEPEPEESAEVDAPVPPSAVELVLLKLLLDNDEHLEWVFQYLDPLWVQHGLAREIISRRLEAYRAGNWQGIPEFLTQFEQAQALVTEIVMQPLVADVDGTKFQRNNAMPNPVQQLADVALRLRNQFLDEQSAALMQKANQPETDDALRLEALVLRFVFRTDRAIAASGNAHLATAVTAWARTLACGCEAARERSGIHVSRGRL